MPDQNDIFSQLLSSSMADTSGSNADAMGALAAIQGSPFLQGRATGRGPGGQIMGALMPLLTSKIYGQQIAKQQHEERVKNAVQVLQLVKGLAGVDLQNAKTRAELKKLGIEEEFLNHYMNLHQAVNGQPTNAGDAAKDFPVGSKLNVGGLSIPLGPAKPAGSEAGLVAQAHPDWTPEQVLENIRKRQDERADDAAVRATNRQIAAEERKQETTMKKPVKLAAGLVFFDRETGDKPTKQITQGEYEQSGGRYIPLNRNESFAVGEAKSALHQLDELEKLSGELLPGQTGGLEGIIGTRVGSPMNLARLRASSDSRVRRFDSLRTLSKIPAIAAMSRTGKMPVIDTRLLEQTDITDHDTKESAKAHISVIRDLLYGFTSNIGLDPDVLRHSKGSSSGRESRPPDTGVLDLGNGASLVPR